MSTVFDLILKIDLDCIAGN